MELMMRSNAAVRSSSLVPCSASVAAATTAEPPLLSQELLDAGWISLFDGRLLDWGPIGDAKWQVVDGTIHTPGDKPGFLMTTERDWRLRAARRVPCLGGYQQRHVLALAAASRRIRPAIATS